MYSSRIHEEPTSPPPAAMTIPPIGAAVKPGFAGDRSRSSIAASPALPHPDRPAPWRTVRVVFGVVPMLAVHFALVAIPFVEFTFWSVVLMLAVSRFIGLGVTAGFHRCLAHHSFKASRLVQFLLAAMGCAALQKGPLWWVAQHRLHHKHSDTADDPHSPVIENFVHAHVGWLFNCATRPTRMNASYATWRTTRSWSGWIDSGCCRGCSSRWDVMRVWGGMAWCTAIA